jgi:hypothetical protein
VWQGDFSAIFEALVKKEEIGMDIDDESCSTQVHVSLATGAWADSLDLVKRVARAAIYFERCIDALVPKKRLNLGQCRSNHASIYYQNLYPSGTLHNVDPSNRPDPSVACAVRAIDAVENISGLVALMCTAPVFYFNNGGRVERDFRWNFVPLVEKDPRGTIEFRLAPGSKDAAEAIGWVLFVVGFVQAALANEMAFVDNCEAKAEELEEFVIRGVEICGYDAKDVEVILEEGNESRVSDIEFWDQSFFIKRGSGSDSSSF